MGLTVCHAAAGSASTFVVVLVCFPHFRCRFIAPLCSATPNGGATIPKPSECKQTSFRLKKWKHQVLYSNKILVIIKNIKNFTSCCIWIKNPIIKCIQDSSIPIGAIIFVNVKF